MDLDILASFENSSPCAHTHTHTHTHTNFVQMYLSGMWLPVVFHWVSWQKYFLFSSSSHSVIDHVDKGMIKYLRINSCKDKFKKTRNIWKEYKSDIECLSKRILHKEFWPGSSHIMWEQNKQERSWNRKDLQRGRHSEKDFVEKSTKLTTQNSSFVWAPSNSPGMFLTYVHMFFCFCKKFYN
jgi:hypothetical protein